ncbi:MAG: hypothetical protein KF866_10120 [Phycisphaeraceae bacterium]|nr:hypothetical protein [Phycisphaeraceae bacterium]MCW5754856.1 hypothetical protein [Phycisphaeraceae bacterium]
MPAPLTHRSSAVRGTRIAQLGVLAMAGVAAAVFTIGLPMVEPASPVAPDFTPTAQVDPNTPAQPTTRGVAPSVYTDIAEGLLSIANVPKRALPPPPTREDNGETDGPAAPAVDTSQLAFVGAVFSADQRIAVLRIDGTQRWIPEGGERDGVRVEEVWEDHAVITRRGVRTELDKAPPSRGTLTRLAAPPSRQPNPRSGIPPVAGGQPGQPRSPSGQIGILAGESQADLEKAAAESMVISEDGTFVDTPEARQQRMREAAERARERALRRGGNN